MGSYIVECAIGRAVAPTSVGPNKLLTTESEFISIQRPWETETCHLDEPMPVYEDCTREVVVGHDVSHTTLDVEIEWTLHAAEWGGRYRRGRRGGRRRYRRRCDASTWTDAETDLEAERDVRL